MGTASNLYLWSVPAHRFVALKEHPDDVRAILSNLSTELPNYPLALVPIDEAHGVKYDVELSEEAKLLLDADSLPGL